MRKPIPLLLFIAIASGFFSGFCITIAVIALSVIGYTLFIHQSFSFVLEILIHAFNTTAVYAILSAIVFSLIALFTLKPFRDHALRQSAFLRYALITFLITGASLAVSAHWIDYRLMLDTHVFVFISIIGITLIMAFVVGQGVLRVFYRFYNVLVRTFAPSIQPMLVIGEGNKSAQVVVPTYELFLKEFEAAISMTRRSNNAVGLLGFKITNQLEIITHHSQKVFDEIEREAIALIRDNARTGEDQCLEQRGAIFSIIFADANAAEKAARRFQVLVEGHTFRYKGEEINVNIAVGVTGVNFAENETKEEIPKLRDIFMLDMLDVIRDAEQEHNVVVRYR